MEPNSDMTRGWRFYRPNRVHSLALQALAGLVIGIYLSITRFEILLGSFIVVIPVLGILEWRREHRLGMMPGLALILVIVLGVAALAIIAPLKCADQRIGPFPGGTMSLNQINEHLESRGLGRILVFPAEFRDENVTIPSGAFKYKDLPVLLAANPSWDIRRDVCISGGTLLWGPEWDRIQVYHKNQTGN